MFVAPDFRCALEFDINLPEETLEIRYFEVSQDDDEISHLLAIA